MARDILVALSADVPAAFAAIRPVDTNDFGFLFKDLQDDPVNLLPERRRTRDGLIALGRTMQDAGGAAETRASRRPTPTSASSSTTTSRSRRAPRTYLPSDWPGEFDLTDLLRFAGVLP